MDQLETAVEVVEQRHERALSTWEELIDEFDLSPAEARFVLAYVGNPVSAARCAREAGYNAASSSSKGAELMADHRVCAAIAQQMNRLQERTLVTKDRILMELAILSFSNVDHFVITDDGQLGLREGVPDYMMRAVQSIKRKITRKTDQEGNQYEWVEIEFKLWNKTEALRLAGQHYGMYTENLNVRGKIEHEHKQVWEFGGRKITFG